MNGPGVHSCCVWKLVWDEPVGDLISVLLLLANVTDSHVRARAYARSRARVCVRMIMSTRTRVHA